MVLRHNVKSGDGEPSGSPTVAMDSLLNGYVIELNAQFSRAMLDYQTAFSLCVFHGVWLL